jgi:hypothetical protein
MGVICDLFREAHGLTAYIISGFKREEVKEV